MARKFRKRLIRRRRRRRTRKRTTRKRGIPRAPNNVNPRHRYVNFSAAGDFILDAAVGTTVQDHVEANSIVDLGAGTSHDVMGRIQWGAFYNSFVVVKSFIKFTISSAISSSDSMITLSLVNDLSEPQSDQATWERRGAKVGFATSTTKPLVLTKSFTPRGWFGRSYNPASQNASMSGDGPVAKVYYLLEANNTAINVNPTAVSCFYKVFYTALLFDPKVLVGLMT